MFDFSTSQVNQAFIDLLADPSMLKEAQERGAEYLKLQIYEDSFMERIFPARPISPAQCDRDVNSPNYRVVIDKEFRDVNATTFTLRGRADYSYVEADRYAVEFFKIESEEYEITEGELRGMRMPVQNLIRHHVAYHIRKKMDEIFLGLCDNAIADSGQLLDLSAVNGAPQIITPSTLVRLFNLIDSSSGRSGGNDDLYLESKTLLMTRSMYNYINTWIQANVDQGVNNGIGADFWKDGYKYDTLFGRRVVLTTKNDLLPENHIYVFTDPEYLGHHFTFNDDRFAIEKNWDSMKWKGWRTFGAAIGNNFSVGKLILPPVS